MCGIAGLVRYDLDVRSQLDRVLAMRDRLRHRGPDGEGIHAEAHCALAHTRLALVDQTAGAEPMRSPCGRFTLVYNGEIYNCAELRARLAGRWQFRTRSDAEVVLAAYATWGPACVQQLDGMFAFFVWDEAAATGFAARDRLGVKPFVYSFESGELLFASEAKALLVARSARPRARPEAILELLVAPCFSGVERPLFDGLEYLPPGHQIEIGRDHFTVSRFADYSLDHADREDARELIPQLREALGRAVARTLVADSPVGLFLSGGLDSTLIGALARQAGASPPSWTVAFEGQESYDYARSLVVTSDDTPFAGLAASELGLELAKVTVVRDGIAADLAALSAHNDAGPAWEQELAQHHLARAAARHVKAVLVGDAADETHYGYHFLLDEEATRRPGRIVERLAAPIVRREVLAHPVEHFDDKYRKLARAAGHRWEAPRDRLLATTWLVVKRWLPRLLHNGDIHCMAHSLEARVPFTDGALLELARSVSPALALRGGVEKALLREAARGVVPETIRLRRKSALPKDQGTQRVYQREAAQVFAGSEWLDRIIDADRLRALCGADTLDERERALLFRVICLGHWARSFSVQL